MHVANASEYHVRIEKWDIERQGTLPQGDAGLQGAVFAIYNRSDNSVMVDGTLRASNTRVGTLTTNAQGVAISPNDWLPYGTFEAVEITAPIGYLNTGVIRRTFNIRENGVIVNLNTANTSIQNNVIRGGVEIEKVDRELSIWEMLAHWTNLRPVQGDATLVGIEFEITNRSQHPVVVDGETFGQGEVIMSIFTDYEVRSGAIRVFATTATDTLPYGTYGIQEINTNNSYLLTDGDLRVFEIRNDQEIVTGSIAGDDLIFSNYVVAGDVEIQKWDLELNASEAMAGTSLEDIRYELTNISYAGILFSDYGRPFTEDNPPRTVEPGEVVTHIYTEWDEELQAYVARTENRSLAVGRYRICEVEANQYYLTEQDLNRPKVCFEFEIRADGEVVRFDMSGNEMIFLNQVCRGDMAGVKIADASVTGQATRLSYIPFAVTHLASGEINVLVTSRNGEFGTHHTWNSRRAGNVNINNHVLEIAERGEIIPNSELDPNGAVWFGIGEFGTVAPVHPTLGAMHYGYHRVTELRAENNTEFDMLEFYVYVSRHSHVINLGTLTNFRPPVEPEPLEQMVHIETIAHTGDRLSQYFVAGAELYFHDIIRMEAENSRDLDLQIEAHLMHLDTDGEITHVASAETINVTPNFNNFNRSFDVVTPDMINTAELALIEESGGLNGHLFWMASVYVADESYEEGRVLMYAHNAEGLIDSQMLTPQLPEPEPDPEVSISTQAHVGVKTPQVPSLPQTGATGNTMIWLGIGLVGLGGSYAVYQKKFNKKTVKR